MDASASTLVYQPLAQNHDIRLLHLEPGHFSDKVQCKLHHANLDDKPIYVALSYVWGDAAVTADVLCNGSEVSVTVSLANALRRLREPDAPVVIWADALCINQADTAERSRQVGIMAEIYKRANQVVVYLGEGTEDTAMAFSTLRRVVSLLEREHDPSRRQQAFGLGYMEGVSSDIPPMDDPGWTALRNLYRSDYFSRIWVVQEVALSAAEPRVICGSHQTWWSKVMKVAVFCLGPNQVLNNGAVKTYAPAAAHIGTVRNALVEGNDSWSLNLLHLLSYTRRSRATDPRDRLFALYGLANDISGPDGPLLKADYTTSLPDVLLLVIKFLFRQGRGFVALAYAGLRSGRPEEVPTWVPDWSSPVHGRSPLNSGLGTAGYNASGGISGLVSFAANHKILRVLGRPIGKVQSVFALSKADITVIPEFRRPGNLRSLWTDIVAPRGTQYPLGGTAVEAFWRTLIANKDADYQPVQAEYYLHFVAFWRQNRLADVAAEALGRTATSPLPTDADRDKHYSAAVKRARDTQFSNYDEEDDPSLAMMDDPFVAAWFCWLRTGQSHPMTTAGAHHYGKSFGMTVTGRSFIVTEDGLMGLAPGTTRVGDVVVIIAGADTPFVLRSRAGEGEGAGRFALVGEAYVHGVMGGEAVGSDGEGRSMWTVIGLE